MRRVEVVPPGGGGGGRLGGRAPRADPIFPRGGCGLGNNDLKIRYEGGCIFFFRFFETSAPSNEGRPVVLGTSIEHKGKNVARLINERESVFHFGVLETREIEQNCVIYDVFFVAG